MKVHHSYTMNTQWFPKMKKVTLKYRGLGLKKILCNIWGWYVKIFTIPYRGRWVVFNRPKTPFCNIKMVPYLDKTVNIQTLPESI